MSRQNSAYPRARGVLPTDYTGGGDGGNSTTWTSLPLETPTFGAGALPRNGSGVAAANGGPPVGYADYSPLDYSSSWQQMPKGLVDAGVDSTGSLGGAGGAIGSKQSKTYRLAVKRTLVSIALSCCFGLVTMLFRGQQSGLEFFAGYLVEQSLS